MSSGDFGTNEIQATRTIGQRRKLASRILNRELGICGAARNKANQNLMAQGMIPSSKVDTIINYDAPVYSGQFSDDGNFFFACVKDFKVRMYDTSNPVRLSISLEIWSNLTRYFSINGDTIRLLATLSAAGH